MTVTIIGLRKYSRVSSFLSLYTKSSSIKAHLIHRTLQNLFTILMQSCPAFPPSAHIIDTFVQQTPNVSNRLSEVFSKVLEFSRLIGCERSAFKSGFNSTRSPNIAVPSGVLMQTSEQGKQSTLLPY